MSVQCPGGCGLPRALFLIVIVPWSSEIPTLLALARHLETIVGLTHMLTSEMQWENISSAHAHVLQQWINIAYLYMALGWEWEAAAIVCSLALAREWGSVATPMFPSLTKLNIVPACSSQGVGEAGTPCALPSQQVLQSVVPIYPRNVIGGCHIWICPSVLAC